MNRSAVEVAGARLRLAVEKDPDEDVEIDHRFHMKDSFEVFNSMRKEGMLCDVVVVAEEMRFSAHKALLSARIPYFRAMFRSDMIESRGNEVYVRDLAHETTEHVLEYAYTGRVRLSIHNVQAIMTGANFFLIDDLMDECGKFLVNRLSIDNAIAIFVFCRSISFTGIEQAVLRFIEKHFSFVSLTPDFLELPIDDVAMVLQLDKLCVDGEEQVFTAMMGWIEADEDGRMHHAAQLLECVRLPLLQPSFLSDFVTRHTLLWNDIPCRNLVDAAKDYIIIPDRRAQPKPFRTDGRMCDQVPALIFVMGGLTTSTGQPHPEVEVYDTATDTWTLCSPMPSARSRVGIAVHERKVYALGGFDGNERIDLCEVFDTESNQWAKLPPLHSKLSAMTVTMLNGIIYVCGGYNGISSLDDVETFDVMREPPEWRPVAKMIKPRSAFGSCVLDGQIYVVGGHDGVSIFACGERYCPQRKVWEEIAPMSSKRCRHGVASLNGKIYAAGGYDGESFLSSVECYDPHKNEWMAVASMNFPRCRASLVVAHGKLYIIGGVNGDNDLSSCEFYSTEKNAWEMRASLKAHAGWISSATVRIPANVFEPLGLPKKCDGRDFTLH